MGPELHTQMGFMMRQWWWVVGGGSSSSSSQDTGSDVHGQHAHEHACMLSLAK